MTETREAWIRREHFIFITVGAMLLLNIPAAIFELGWKSAAFNTGLVLGIYVLWAWRHRDGVLFGWLVFGVAAGFTELVADWWLVHRTHSLVYPAGEPHLVASPAYMPFAWTLIMAQMVGIADWLEDRLPLWGASLATAAICGLNIPAYEHLAKDAEWWYYQDTPMLFNAPYYIILGEAILGLPLVFFAAGLAKGSLPRAFGLGVIAGLVILVAYVIAWWLVGPCVGAVIQLPC